MNRRLRPTAYAVSIILSLAALGCQPGDITGGDDFGTGETGDAGRVAGEPCGIECPTLDDLCNVGQCSNDGGKLRCFVQMSLPPGHFGDFAVSSSSFGDLSWNELPWNADAGVLEDAELTGAPAGSVCSWASVNSASIGESSMGERYVDFVCADYTAGDWSSVRVELD